MAVLKHLAIKKRDYGDIQHYLLFKCEKGTHKPIRDETGHMVPRDFFIQDGINCTPFPFDAECAELNRHFQKNHRKGEIMAHHYIISFDPRDADDHDLTPHKAHALAKEFAEYFFAGHQALIVTHADGNNHSGNIHTHIVINSLRKEKIEWKSFMENNRDCLAGYKHHLTNKLLHRMHERLYEICEREHLYTVEINQPADRKITDREYRAQRRGQQEKDRINARIRADGYVPVHPNYETVKQQIRDAIDKAAAEARDEAEFMDILTQKYKLSVRMKRGRYSFIHPERDKPITGRCLGNAYQREAILEKTIANVSSKPEQRSEFATLPHIFLIPSHLRLVVDLQTCVKAQQSRAYARKVELSNLQRMARTVAWIQENGIGTIDKLEAAKSDLENKYYALSHDLNRTKHELIVINQQIRHVGRYYSNRKVYERYRKADDKTAFRAEHRSQIEAYEESLQALDELFMGEDFPSLKALKAQKAVLIEKRDRLQAECRPVAAEIRNMKVVWKNVCNILGRNEEHDHSDHATVPPKLSQRSRKEISL